MGESAPRRQATPAEASLWEALRSSRLGARFRRQHPAGALYCPYHRLAVAVDGNAATPLRGCRVLRFTNDEVLNDLPGVLDRIALAIDYLAL